MSKPDPRNFTAKEAQLLLSYLVWPEEYPDYRIIDGYLRDCLEGGVDFEGIPPEKRRRGRGSLTSRQQKPMQGTLPRAALST